MNLNKLNLGHTNLKLKKSWHNHLNNFFLGNRNNTTIFDYKFTYIYIAKALHIFTCIFKSKGNILIINTNPELSKVVYHMKKNIKSKNIFFSDCGFTKGTLTNSQKVFNKIKTFNLYGLFIWSHCVQLWSLLQPQDQRNIMAVGCSRLLMVARDIFC